MLSYLSPVKYGIWLTLSAILQWITFFDVGLSHGLRNKFAIALLNKDVRAGSIFTSTTYTIVGAIATTLILLAVSIYYVHRWQLLPGLSFELTTEVQDLLLVVLIFFSIRLVASLIFALLAAEQKVSAIGFLDLIVSALSLLAVYLLKQFTQNSLFWAGAALSFIIMAVPLLANLWYFRKDYKLYRPTLKYVDFSYAKDLLTLGGNFFLLQAATIILFSSNNFVIAALLGAEDVTIFNIPFKYMAIVTMVSVIILNPYWSAATEAYTTKDYSWFRKSIRNLIVVWFLMAVLLTVMVLLSPVIYKIWLSNKVTIPYSVTMLMAVYVGVLAWNNVFVYLINGIGKIRLQVYTYLFAACFVVPLAYLFVKVFGWGLNGILIANIICILPASILMPIQFWLIIRERASGVFLK
ncbi:MATE family efflux transporter [Pontibacter pudoricolor]|uniref:MATE family efflux transporter n=1 Tax=Pontibacter pudoricolor TaxID=2694930 RepID=UPI001390C389|nr:MATE family efflux transporter [Pontibacter pudoricolor]